MGDDMARDAAMWRMRKWADTQRLASEELRQAIGLALEAGISWSAIGNAIGLPRETAFRQYQGGGDIRVVRATRTKKESG
jgi:hypothetical protein